MADLKTLRVCLSSELPAILQRSPNYLYLTYDNLRLYAGQNDIDENYSIADAIPADPVHGMIYILSSDGTVHRFVDYKDNTIAKIEDKSQIDLLKKANTMFFVNSRRRYFDTQKRTLTLPFNNGNYELNVSTMNDQIFDNNTILKYNTDRERFEVYGDLDEEFIDFSKPFRGKETKSIKLNVDGPRISANVKISNAADNIIRAVGDGLYVKSSQFVPRSEFDEWSNNIMEYKKYGQDILDLLESELAGLTEIISEENLRKEIMEKLREKYNDIDTALENYQTVVENMSKIETEVIQYASQLIEQGRTFIENMIASNSAWDDLDASAYSYNQEINYYEKAEEYLYPELTEEDLLQIFAAATSYYMNTVGEDINMNMKLGITVNNKEYIVTVRDIIESESSSITSTEVLEESPGDNGQLIENDIIEEDNSSNIMENDASIDDVSSDEAIIEEIEEEILEESQEVEEEYNTTIENEEDESSDEESQEVEDKESTEEIFVDENLDEETEESEVVVVEEESIEEISVDETPVE